MSSNFAGHVVIITGAGSGIGRATALKMARAGATLALSDINSDAVLSTQEMCETSTREHYNNMASVVDVQSSDGVNEFVERVVTKYSRINHVFNCAGVNPTKLETESITDAYWQKLVDTNMKGTFAMTRACIPHMTRGSSFVNVSSMCGLYPTANFAVYCATKYAIIGFSKCVALELGPRGIRVNIIAPGTIETPTNISVRAGPEQLEMMTKDIGLRRVGTAEEVADVVCFLFSEESRYMNGSVVEINGGIGVAG